MDKQSARKKLRAHHQQQVPLGAFTNAKMKVGDSQIQEPVQMLQDDEPVNFEEDPLDLSGLGYYLGNFDDVEDVTFEFDAVEKVSVESIEKYGFEHVLESDAFHALIMRWRGCEQKALDDEDDIFVFDDDLRYQRVSHDGPEFVDLESVQMLQDSNPIPSSSTTRAVVPIPQDDEPFIFEKDPSAFEYWAFDEKDTEDDDKTLCVRKVANLKGKPHGDE